MRKEKTFSVRPNSIVESNVMAKAYSTIREQLESNQIGHHYHRHESLLKGADLLRSLPFDPTRMFKTLAFSAPSGDILLATLPVPAKLDYAKLARASGLSRASLTIAGREIVEEVLGCEEGGISPLASSGNSRLFIDESITSGDVVYTGSGVPTETLELTSQDLLRLAQAHIVGLVKH